MDTVEKDTSIETVLVKFEEMRDKLKKLQTTLLENLYGLDCQFGKIIPDLENYLGKNYIRFDRGIFRIRAWGNYKYITKICNPIDILDWKFDEAIWKLNKIIQEKSNK